MSNRMKINNKRGFTLIELIMTTAITVLLIGAAGVVMILGLRVFNTSAIAAQQQKDTRLVETALKDSLATATSYNFSASKSGDVQLFFSSDTLTMKMNSQTLTLDTINSVEVTYELRTTGACYATYVITTDGVSQKGAVVMNNVTSATASTTTYTLNAAQVNTLNIEMP